ncbi:MAG: DUF4352 domain-containing protein [Bacilli bacterium]
MAKFCTNCGNELTDDNASICIKCGKEINENKSNGGKKKNKKGLPTWAIILIVVGCTLLIPIIIFIIFAIFSYNYIKDNDIQIKDYIEEITTVKGTIGDTLINDDVRITLTDALIYSEINGDEFTDKPSYGKEFLIFFFNIENMDDESKYISTYNFSGYVDDVAVQTKDLFNDVEDTPVLGVDLASGKKARGYVAFEINEDWKKFEIRYKENSFDEDSIIFTVVNENNNQNEGV